MVRKGSSADFTFQFAQILARRVAGHCITAVDVAGLAMARYAAPRLLSRRQHLLGLGEELGGGGWISNFEPAESAISD
jgi:hypothetical protein